MSLVLTNWKAAFLRERGSGFLAVYAVFVSVFGFVAWIRGSSESEIIQGLLGFLLLTGPVYAVLRMQRGMVTKPMLFCLPRYRESLRALSFSAALLAGLGWATFGPFPPDVTAAEIYINLAGGFLTGMVLYLALTTPRLILSRRAFIWFRRAAIPLVILVFEVIPMPREAPVVVWPVLMPVLVALGVFVWIRLGDMECVRRGQRITLEDAIERGPARKSPGTTLPWVEKWLQSQMERQSYLQEGRFVWGQLYATVGRLLPYWKWVLGSLLGCAWLLGYMGPAANVVFAASGSLAWIQTWPVASPLVLPGGRRERCRATIGAVVAVSLLLLAAASAVVVVSWLLTPFLGGAPAEGPEAPYVGLQAHSVFWTCLLVPWFSAFGLLGIRIRSLAELCVLMAVVATALGLSTLTVPIWLAWTLPVVVAGVYAGGWLSLLLVLWAASRKWDLVSQRLMSDN
jgi:hypothetical protein